MVRIIVSVVIYALSLVGNAQSNNHFEMMVKEENGHNISIEIKKLSSDQGKIYFGLYDSQINFSSRKALIRTNARIINGEVKVVFENLEPGTYAVTCFHDANDNGKMDFENSGMPIEDYGMTNNVMSFGPPQFTDGKFELSDKDLTFEIKL